MTPAKKPRGLRRQRIATLVAASVLAAGLAAMPSPVRADTPPTLSEIDGGDRYTCAVDVGGSVYCWGSNDQGRLGIDGHSTSTIPQRIAGVSTAHALDVGGSAACVALTDGHVRCWGVGAGRTSDGSAIDEPVPVEVAGIDHAVAVAVGAGFACALLDDGTVRCWGSNDYGMLGDGTTIARDGPVAPLGVTDAIAIAAGPWHACAVLGDGTARCWGSNLTSQLGIGTISEVEAPSAVIGPTGVTAISLSTADTCAIVDGGAVTCWGGYSQEPIPPTLVSDLQGQAVALDNQGAHHACVVLAGGTAACWGFNGNGQLGIVQQSTVTPLPVTGLTGVTGITTGGYHSCATFSSNGGACWGWNADGQLGDRTTVSGSAPRPISWEPDTTPPVTGAPRLSLWSGINRDGPVWGMLIWRSGDGPAGTGVLRYELQASRDGGTSWSASEVHLDRRADLGLAVGSSVRYRVRALDGAGNAGDWAVGPNLRPSRVQDGSPSIVYHGAWSRRVSTAYSGGATRMTTDNGASATFAFTGQSVAFMTRTSPTRGRVRIYVDGAYQATVELQADGSGLYRAIPWVRNWATSGSHEVRIVAVVTKDHPRVDLDAFVVVR